MIEPAADTDGADPDAGTDVDADADTDADLPEQMRVRREKRARMLAAGQEPYPLGFPRTTTLARLRETHPDLPPGAATGERVGVTGRVIFLRDTGRLCFVTLRDGDGTELQAMLSERQVGAEALEDFKRLVDLGDLVGVTGEVVTSRRGELSVLADEWTMTAKALRPLPVAHKPMGEESRVRQRYVDLIVRPQAREMARNRANFVKGIRDALHRRGFLEIETPVLQALHGGAAARPFVTRANALDRDFYLRIALELHLKRAVVGGIEKVFEVNRVFRNEGMDSTHSPEFTMVELYEAYADYDTIAVLSREVLQEAWTDAFGGTLVRHFDGTEYDLGGAWRAVTMFGSLSGALGEEVTPDTPYETLKKYADRHDIAVNAEWGPGRLAEELFDRLVSHQLVEPTFVRDYPVETCPLTRAHRTEPGLAEKWDLYIQGIEMGTAYTELVDPVVQRERLTEQARLAAAGDAEAMRLDEDFLRALEYGMPPAGGVGFGIDRLLMVATGLGIRETVLFPLVRPE